MLNQRVWLTETSPWYKYLYVDKNKVEQIWKKRELLFFFSFSNSRVHPSLHFCARTTVCQIREARVALVFTSHQCGPGSYVGCLLRQEFFFFYVKYIGNNSFLNFQLFFLLVCFFFVLILQFSPLLKTRLERQKENHIRINNPKMSWLRFYLEV